MRRFPQICECRVPTKQVGNMIFFQEKTLDCNHPWLCDVRPDPRPFFIGKSGIVARERRKGYKYL